MQYALNVFAPADPNAQLGKTYLFDAGTSDQAITHARRHIGSIVGPDDLFGFLFEGDGEGRWNFVETVDATHAEVTL